MQLDPDAYGSKVKEMVSLQNDPEKQDNKDITGGPNPEKKQQLKEKPKRKGRPHLAQNQIMGYKQLLKQLLRYSV